MIDRYDIPLGFIDATDRDVWVQVGMGLKADLGEEGFALWDAWSRTADNYDASVMAATWRSFRGQGVTGRTILHLARQAGWTGSEDYKPPKRPMAAATPPVPKDTAPESIEAMQKAIREAVPAEGHPYMERKGFGYRMVLVDAKERILLPIRKRTGLTSIQTIDADGNKRFWPDAVVSGGYLRIGRGKEHWACEGYATGLTLLECLDVLQRDASVWVAFSAHNLVKVARKGWRVVADNDASGTGAKYAKRTGCKWTMPDEQGDLNDLAQREEIYAAVSVVREIIPLQK